MIVSFKEYYPFDKTKATNFQDKIARGLKVHTLRQDRKDRFQRGLKLHMSTGVRTKNYFCFDDTKTCTSKQQILIVYDPVKNSLEVRVNRKKLKPQQVESLISNDGFDTRQDFIKWFFPEGITMWSGKIIHWTNLKY